MKLRNILISFIALAGSLLSCDSADEAIKKAFKVDTSKVVFNTAEAAEEEVTLNAGYAWTAVVSEDAASWLTVENALGEGSSETQSFYIKVAANTGQARVGKVSVCMSGTKAHVITVLQAGVDGSLDVPETPEEPGNNEDPDNNEEPETSDILYLKPNANWASEGARFAAYFFGNGEKWVDMTGPNDKGCYECKKEAGYSSVIFCRMNPAASENVWDNKWSQTADLTIPTDNKVCYVLDEGSWEAGKWTSYPPVVDDSENPAPDTPDNPGQEEVTAVRIYLSTAWGWPYIWCWDANGTQIFAGAEWPGTRYHGEENGYYYWNIPAEYIGKTVNLLAVKEDQSEKTSDFNNVVLDKNVYFYLDWTQEAGCYLVKENK